MNPRTVAHQAFLSMGLSQEEYWSGLPFPRPGVLPNPGIESMSPALAGGFFTNEPPGKPKIIQYWDVMYTILIHSKGSKSLSPEKLQCPVFANCWC